MGFTQSGGGVGQATGIADTIQQLASQIGLHVNVQNPAYVQCGFTLEGGRRQLVHIMPVGDLAGQTVVHFWTPVAELPGGALPQQVANGLLAENCGFKIGSFGIRDLQGTQLLVFYQNMLLESLSPEALGTVVSVLASTGDQYEQKLGGADRF
jgi:hypothetical protein